MMTRMMAGIPERARNVDSAYTCAWLLGR